MSETPNRPLTLLVVDDHEVVRQGLASMLDRRPGFQVIAEAGTVAESLEMARRFQPDLVIMPIVNWLVVAGEITIGALLILGLFTRFAAVAGALMMGLFFVATWDFSHGVINEQLMYGIVTGVLGVVAAGRYYGFDAVLEKAATIRRAPQLRYVMG